MAFKIASDKAQDRARRIIPRRLGDFGGEPTDMEKIENLKRAKTKVDADIVQTKKRGLGIRHPEVIQLKAEATRLRDELHAIGARRKFPPDFNRFLCDVIKAEVTLAQWNIWVNKAKELSERVDSQEECGKD